MSRARQFAQVSLSVARKRHLAGVDAEDLAPAVLTRRTVKDDAPRRLDAELAVDTGELQRHLDELPHKPDLVVQSTYVVKGDVQRQVVGEALRRRLQHHLGGLRNHAWSVLYFADAV